MGIKIYKNGAWADAGGVKIYKNGAWANAKAVRVYKNGAWVDVWTDWSPHIDVNKVIYSGSPSDTVEINVPSGLNYEYAQEGISRGYTKAKITCNFSIQNYTFRDQIQPYGETYMLTLYRGTDASPTSYELEKLFRYYSLYSTFNTSQTETVTVNLSYVVTQSQPVLTFKTLIALNHYDNPVELKVVDIELIQ